MAILHLTDGDFEGFIKASIAVVDFWATWCGPCRAFGPIFESASEKYPSVKFGKYEITDANRAAAAKYGVRSIPSILAFKNGEFVDAKTGMMDDKTFDDWIKKLLV